eukprot:s2327_g3.t1
MRTPDQERRRRCEDEWPLEIQKLNRFGRAAFTAKHLYALDTDRPGSTKVRFRSTVGTIAWFAVRINQLILVSLHSLQNKGSKTLNGSGHSVVRLGFWDDNGTREL